MLVRNVSREIDSNYINFDIARYFGINEGDTVYIHIYSLGQRAFSEFVETLGENLEDYLKRGILVNQRVRNFEGNFVEGSIYNADSHITILRDGEAKVLEVGRAITEDKSPLNMSGISYMIVSDEMIEEIGVDERNTYMLVNSSEPGELEDEIANLSVNLFTNNFEEASRSMRNTVIIIWVFLYGFITVIITIGITNIINTLSTSLNLRKREFAILKAVGTTSKEFKNIINLESIFLGTKVLLISIPIGMGLSYMIYYLLVKDQVFGINYNPNISSIIISVIAVFALVKIIMSYWVKKISKENIIETIRQDNI